MAKTSEYRVVQSSNEAAVQTELNNLAGQGGKPILLTSSNNQIVVIVELPLKK